MKAIGRLLICALFAGMTVAAVAQSTPAQQDQQKPQTNQNSSGVAQPPPDDTIRADEDMTNPPPPPAASLPTPATAPAPPKPSAAIPAPEPNPAATAASSAPTAKPALHPAFPGETDNTDDGIVTVVPPHASASPNAPAQTGFRQRETSDSGDASDYGIVTYVPFNPNDLRTGTNISVRLKEELSTKETEAGTPFTATVRMDVYNDNTVVIPAGSELRGRVLHVSQGHHFGLHASMRLHADSIVLPDGTTYHIDADVIESYAPGTSANDEGSVVASTHYTKDAIQYGGAVGAGAVVGGVVGGPVGAGAGALVGAGAETTHLLLQSPSAAKLPKDSVLIFSLNEPMHLTPAKN